RHRGLRSGGRRVYRRSPVDRGAAGEESVIMSSSLRRGLPRIPGGEAWPPEGTLAPSTEFVPQVPGAAPAVDATTPEPAAAVESVPKPATPAPAPTSAGETFRRGLPRVAGGEPWPPADAPPAGLAAAVSSPAAAKAPPSAPAEQAPPESAITEVAPSEAVPAATAAPGPAQPPPATEGSEARRGLPRPAGGEPWPPQGTLVANAFAAAPQPEPSAKPADEEPAALEPQP